MRSTRIRCLALLAALPLLGLAPRAVQPPWHCPPGRSVDQRHDAHRHDAHRHDAHRHDAHRHDSHRHDAGGATGHHGSVRAGGCAHCAQEPGCDPAGHCAAGGGALEAAAAVPVVRACHTLLRTEWLRDRPLSCNPTPPIPPPQAVLRASGPIA